MPPVPSAASAQCCIPSAQRPMCTAQCPANAHMHGSGLNDCCLCISHWCCIYCSGLLRAKPKSSEDSTELPSMPCTYSTSNSEYACFKPGRDVCAPPASIHLAGAARGTYLSPQSALTTALSACYGVLPYHTVTLVTQ